MLHCFYLAFKHPVNGCPIKVYLEPDGDLKHIYRSLGMYEQFKQLAGEYADEIWHVEHD